MSQDKPKKNDIFVLWAGANEAFSSPSGDFYGVEAVELIDEQIGTLHKNGEDARVDVCLTFGREN